MKIIAMMTNLQELKLSLNYYYEHYENIKWLKEIKVLSKLKVSIPGGNK
jgi:hypothetical protein